MRNIVEHLRDKGRRLVVMPPDERGVSVVYAITHAHTPELAGLPAVDISRAMRKLEDAQHLQQRMDACKTDKERKRVQAEAEAVAEAFQQQLAEDCIGTPERRDAYLARCRAVVCAAVMSVGAAKEGVSFGVHPMGTQPEDICEPLGEDSRGKPIYLQPLRIVPDREAAAEPGTMCVLDYEHTEVMKLQLVFSGAFTVQHLVTPLLGAPRPAGEVPRDGGDVRVSPERVPARPRQAGGSAGSRVRGHRKEG